MDKETLSNYGWIVIAVLVLVVMIALAGPFGNFVSEAVQSTTKGLFDVNKNALDAADITIDDQEFNVPNGNGGAGENGDNAGGETPIEYKLSGTWEFNDDLTDPGFDGIVNIRFNSMGMEFDSIDFDHPWGFTMRYYETNGTGWDVYGLGWHGGYEAKMMEFTSEQSVSKEFYEWFTANATQQTAPTLITFTVDGHEFQAKNGMTWVEWSYSEFDTNGASDSGVCRIEACTHDDCLHDGDHAHMYMSGFGMQLEFDIFHGSEPVCAQDLIIAGEEYTLYM